MPDQQWRPSDDAQTCEFCDEWPCKCAGEEIVGEREEVPTIGKGCTSEMTDPGNID